MARFVKDATVRQIQTLYRAGALGGLTDRELLEQFAAGSEPEVAFEVLVERHGPMVRATCRSLLGDFHEADDAFQATFLVLARRAGSIRKMDAVASWLYGVAARICLRARAEAMRRRTLSRYLTARARHEERTALQPPREEMPELFEEVARLPARYRAPIVLCYLECQTYEQAARALHFPVATEGLGQSRDMARLIVAKALSAPESEFWTIIRRSVSDLELVERED